MGKKKQPQAPNTWYGIYGTNGPPLNKKESLKKFSIDIETDNLKNIQDQLPAQWVYISEKQATSNYPKGYYQLISYIDNYNSQDLVATVEFPGGKRTPKEGESVVDGIIRVSYLSSKEKCERIIIKYIISNSSWAQINWYNFTIPPPSKEEIESSGLRVEIRSLEQLVKLMDIKEDEEDNEIDLTHVLIDQRIFNSLRDQAKAMFEKSINPYKQITNMFGNRMGWNYPYLGENMPKLIMTPDKSTGCHDMKFSFYGKSEWKIVEACIALMKGTIPASDRMYDPTTKTWSFLDKYIDAIKKLATTIGMDVEIQAPVSADGFFYEHAVNSPSVENKDTLAFKLIKLLGITEDILKDSLATKKAYRSKALELHPDRNNGDGSRMSELNSVWSAYNAS